MPVRGTWTGGGIESIAVISDGKTDLSVLVFAGDENPLGLSVPDGVDGEFSNDADDAMDDCIWKSSADDVEADEEQGRADVWQDGLSDGLVKPRLRKSPPAQIAETVTQVFPTGFQGLASVGDVFFRLERLGIGLGHFCCVKLQGDAREKLGKVIV